MKTLYISDLDGTLLSSSAELSASSKEKLIRLCENGVCFSAASARSAATAAKILGDLPLRVPVILMNGACIYDLAAGEYVHTAVISREAQAELFRIMNGTSGFLYTVDGGKLHTYYERTETEHSREFLAEREQKYGKMFTRVGSFGECLGLGCVYFSVAGLESELRGLYDELSKVGGIRTEFYRDVYKKDFWYLEVCCEGASKYDAAMWMRKEYGFDTLVGFGDNLNDLSLFEACDESYAVSNAKDEVKARASGVIGSNDEDAVVNFIIERTGL